MCISFWEIICMPNRGRCRLIVTVTVTVLIVGCALIITFLQTWYLHTSGGGRQLVQLSRHISIAFRPS